MLSQFIEPYSPRLIPVWNGYVTDIETSTKSLMKRFMLSPGYETAGIRLLRFIFACVDWNYMLKPNISDLDKYMYHIRHVKEDLDNTFEHTTTGITYFNFFHDKTLGKVRELILPVEDITPVNRLPFDKGWIYWKQIKPVRYLAHNSKELARNIEMDRVKFYKHQPTYSVITIDVVALVFKYMKFLQEAPLDPELKKLPEKVQRIFLHKHVLNSFMTDLLDIFLIRLMMNVSDMAKVENMETDRHEDTGEIMYGFVGHRYGEAATALYNQMINVKNGTVKPRSILSSPLLTSRMSIVNRTEMILEELDIPDLRQFEFYRVLRDLDMFKLVMNMYQLNNDNQLYSRFSRAVKPKIYKLLRSKIWLYSKDLVIRDSLEKELENLNERIQFREV